jgi:predicted Rossmann fold nucleotide-binding protein DprA/Smf involved in DNA uptake
MTTIELAKSIQDRLDLLYGEIAVLESARRQLHADSVASTPTSPGSAAKNKRKPPRRRRRATPNPTAEVVPAAKLEAMLVGHDGITTAALAQLANARPEQVLTLLRELEAAGRVRRTGQRRGTRWHAITDEDRIRERAAELERQSRRSSTAA